MRPHGKDANGVQAMGLEHIKVVLDLACREKNEKSDNVIKKRPQQQEDNPHSARTGIEIEPHESTRGSGPVVDADLRREWREEVSG